VDLENYKGRIVLIEQDKGALLEIPAVRKSVNFSCIHAFDRLAEFVGNHRGDSSESSYPPRLVSKAFVQILFPYFESKRGKDVSAVEKDKVEALDSFWQTVKAVVRWDSHLLGDLETYLLQRDSGAPEVFFGNVLSVANRANRTDLMAKYFTPVYVALRDENFDVSLADRLG